MGSSCFAEMNNRRLGATTSVSSTDTHRTGNTAFYAYSKQHLNRFLEGYGLWIAVALHTRI